MATVSDSFTGTLSTGDWFNVPTGATPPFSTASNQLRCDSGSAAAMRWVSDTFGADQFAQVRIKVLPSSNWGHGPMINLTDGNTPGYVVSFNGTRAFVEKGVGSANLVLDVTSITLSVDDFLGVSTEVSGSDKLLKLWRSTDDGASWTQLGTTYTDTSPYSGTRIGVGTYAGDSAARVDDFSGGDYSGGYEASGSPPTGPGLTSSPLLSGRLLRGLVR